MTLSALDESGKPVDWWFLYKVPKLGRIGQNKPTTGFEYIYFDSTQQKVTKSNFCLENAADDGALAKTLGAVFAQPKGGTGGWILYNDEPPEDQPNSTLGHSKGVLAFDLKSNSAIWLLHSWPKFPDPNSKSNAMPSADYGQTFVCISLPLDELRQVATQMKGFQQPNVYDRQIPGSMLSADPIAQLTPGASANAAGGASTIKILSQARQSFTVIAKNRNWGKDFWNDLVDDKIGANIAVETWIRGTKPATTSSGNPFKVEDIKFITFENLGLAVSWAWSEAKDHAKWGISEEIGKPWVCVGDINRMVSQEKRGGCTIAWQNHALWAALSLTDKFVVPNGQEALVTPDHAEAMVRVASHVASIESHQHAGIATNLHAKIATALLGPANQRTRNLLPPDRWPE